MSLAKLLLKNTITYIKNNSLLCFIAKYIIYLYLRILFFTYRLEVTYHQDPEKPFNQIEGIYYFWNQDLIMGMYFFFKQKCVGHCIISSSKDGKIVGFLSQKLGFKVIYGSSQKKSISLAKYLIDVIDVNKRICLVGDGSRGPALKLQNHIRYFSAKTKVPIIHIECRTSSAISIKKCWNKFQIPLPFSKISIHVHKPYMPSLQNYRKDLHLCDLKYYQNQK